MEDEEKLGKGSLGGCHHRKQALWRPSGKSHIHSVGLSHDLWGNRRTRPAETVPPTLAHGREAGPSPGLLPNRWISLEAAGAIKCQLDQRVLIQFADG